MMWNDYGMSGGNWWWMVPMMVVLLGALIAVVLLVVRASTGPRGNNDEAMDTLRRRFASGEIKPDEFEKRSRLLKG